MDNTTKTKQELDKQWLDGINANADAKARELSTLMACIVVPMVFVVEAGVDAAVAFLKKPDAKLAYKMMLQGRESGLESASELLSRAQLIRTEDIKQFNPTEGTVGSDARFMDVNGKYAPENTDLNTGLLIEATSLISPLSDMFKKK